MAKLSDNQCNQRAQHDYAHEAEMARLIPTRDELCKARDLIKKQIAELRGKAPPTQPPSSAPKPGDKRRLPSRSQLMRAALDGAIDVFTQLLFFSDHAEKQARLRQLESVRDDYNRQLGNVQSELDELRRKMKARDDEYRRGECHDGNVLVPNTSGILERSKKRC